jgi:hypothetical protein
MLQERALALKKIELNDNSDKWPGGSDILLIRFLRIRAEKVKIVASTI